MPETLTPFEKPQTVAGQMSRQSVEAGVAEAATTLIGQPRTAAAKSGARGRGAQPYESTTATPAEPISDAPETLTTNLTLPEVLGQVGDVLISSPYGPKVPDEMPLPINRDALQRQARKVVAGGLVTTTLASGLAQATASAEPAGRVGSASARAETVHKSQPRDRAVFLAPGGTIYDVAQPIAERRGIPTMEEVADIEIKSGVESEYQAEHLQPGSELHIPAAGASEYIREPRGSNLSTTAAQNGLTLKQLLGMNRQYRTHPDLVQAGALLKVSGGTSSTTPTTSHSSHPKPQSAPIQPVIKPTLPKKKPEPTLPVPATHAARQKAATPVSKPAPKPVEAAKPQPIIKITSPILPPLHLTPFNGSPTHAAETAKVAKASEPSHPAEQPPRVVNIEAQSIKTNYDIHADVLSKSGLNVHALRHALQRTYPHMAGLAGDFHALEQKYGINALYAAAAAAQESGGATSQLAKDRNNLFGINAVDADPNKAFGYKTKADSINAFGELLAQKYLHKDGQYFNGSSLHGIYKDYSSSHDTEAGEIASIMTTLASHGKGFYHIPSALLPQAQSHTRHRLATGSGLFRAFEHAWGQAGSTVSSSLHNPIEKTWRHADSAAEAVSGKQSHHPHHKSKQHKDHIPVNAAIYTGALLFNGLSYPPTSELAMTADHTGTNEAWLKGPRKYLDCSGLVSMARYVASGGIGERVENTTTERTDGYWMKVPFSVAAEGDIDQPAAYGGDHVEIIHKIKGNYIYTFGSHTSHAPQPDQIGPEKYVRNPDDLYLRYVGPGAPIGNHIHPMKDSHSAGWGIPRNLKHLKKPENHDKQTLRQQAGSW